MAAAHSSSFPHHARTVLITGATGGIGGAIALALAKEGKNVFMTGRDGDKLRVLVDEIKREKMKEEDRTGIRRIMQVIDGFSFDMSDMSEIRRAMDEICKLQIDTVIFNAGVMFPKGRSAVTDNPIDSIEETLKINVVGHYLMARLLLAKRPLSQSIKFICTASNTAKYSHAGRRWPLTVEAFHSYFKKSFFFSDGWASYFHSKFAVIVLAQYLESLSGVRGVAVHPGISRTNIFNSIPAWQRLLLRIVARHQNIEDVSTVAARLIENGLHDTETDWSDSWFCEDIIETPCALPMDKRAAFIAFLDDLTDPFMPRT